MGEGDAGFDPSLFGSVLAGMVAVLAVVLVGAVYFKIRNLFIGSRRLKTERRIDKILRKLGLRRSSRSAQPRAGSGGPNGPSWDSVAANPELHDSSARFWVSYANRRGVVQALRRHRLEKRIRELLGHRSRPELDEIAASLMLWPLRECPDHELFIPRPPHRISLRDRPRQQFRMADTRRGQYLESLKTRPDEEVLALILGNLGRRSSMSLQWLHDCLVQGWFGEVGATKSRTMRLNMDSERATARK